jgi:purine nucleosidase
MARKIIIDTDPGQDDAVAILLALASPELEVLGITAVAGNIPLDLTALNARKICELAGRADVKVFAGADRPLNRELVTAEYVHGDTGLDGPDLPDPQMPLQDQHAVDFLIESLEQAGPDGVTLCTLGPLTNIAMALRHAPHILPNIREIVTMGGGLFEGGNATPAAEFNIYVDPQAADIVFRCGRPITLFPLDLTHQCLAGPAEIEPIRNLGTRVGVATAEMLDFFRRYDEEKYGVEGGPLHDPNVIAWLLAPELYGGRLINVEVEIQSELTMGMTVADWWQITDRPRNVTYVRDVDAQGFFRLITERLAHLP